MSHLLNLFQTFFALYGTYYFFIYAVLSLPTSYPILYAITTLDILLAVFVAYWATEVGRLRRAFRHFKNFHFKEHFEELVLIPIIPDFFSFLLLPFLLLFNPARFLKPCRFSFLFFSCLQQQNKFRCYKTYRSYGTLMLLARASSSCLF